MIETSSGDCLDEDIEERFEFLFESIPLGIIYHDASGAIVKANSAATKMLGLRRDETIGRNSFDPRWEAIREDGSPFPGEEHPVMVSLRTGKEVQGTVLGVRNMADEKHHWLLVSSIPRFSTDSDRPIQVIVTIADITDRVLAREAERKSRELFISLFENMSEGVALHEIILNAEKHAVDYRILDTNTHYETNVGIPRELAIGKLGSELYGTNPAPYLNEFVQVAASGKSIQFETYFPPLDKYFVISVAPLGKGPEGRDRFATIFFDVSSRKKGENERARLLEELERKNAELESIVYVSSHDLRSPLVNIQGFSTRLKKLCGQLAALALKAGSGLSEEEVEKLRVTSEEKIPQALDFILSSGRKMDELIGGLLRLSRTGRAELKPETLDMKALLREIAGSMAFQLEKAGALLEIEELPSCEGDREQISQIFSNLLDNAIKYRDPSKPLNIRVSGKVSKNMAEYIVEDNGIGISEEYLSKIWELFHRLDPRDGAGGEGIGLTLVRRIAERHRGKTWVESEKGEGSRFFVQLVAGTTDDGKEARHAY